MNLAHLYKLYIILENSRVFNSNFLKISKVFCSLNSARTNRENKKLKNKNKLESSRFQLILIDSYV